jgi:hypothetical protein
MRFGGTCEAIAAIEIGGLVTWIAGIGFADWPQQHRIDAKLRPAMVTDPAWHGFGAKTDAMVAALLELFPGCAAHQRMLSVVMPGHSIEPHIDRQPPNWVCRVHVPLTTNDQSQFIVGGAAHRMRVGMAYRVNTTVEHSVTNDGDTPRVHFMFDVRTA